MVFVYENASNLILNERIVQLTLFTNKKCIFVFFLANPVHKSTHGKRRGKQEKVGGNTR